MQKKRKKQEQLIPGKMYELTGEWGGISNTITSLHLYSGPITDHYGEIIGSVLVGERFVLLAKARKTLYTATKKAFMQDLKVMTSDGLVGYMDCYEGCLKLCQP